MARALQITVREAILLHFYVVFYGSGFYVVFYGPSSCRLGRPILSLFTVIARSWAIFVQAWKADLVAIYGDRAILGYLCAGLAGRFCRYLR